MDTTCPEIGTDDMLEFCLMPWMAFAEEEITATHITTAGKVSHLLVSSKRFEVFENFIFSLPDRVLRVFLKNELFRRGLIALRRQQERYEEICELIRDGVFADGSDLLEVWDNANYKIWEGRYRKSLSALTRFRIRKRNPPPPSICQGGRKTRCLDHSARAVMAGWFLEHANHPYASFFEREQIAQGTGLTHTQIKTWFANARRRKQLHEKRMARAAVEVPKQTKHEDEKGTSTGPSLKEMQPQPAPGSQQEKRQPQPAPGTQQEKRQPQPAPGSQQGKRQPQPAPGSQQGKRQPQPAPGSQQGKRQLQPAPGSQQGKRQPQPAPGSQQGKRQPQPAPGSQQGKRQLQPAPGTQQEKRQAPTTIRCMINQPQEPSSESVVAAQEPSALQGLVCMYNKLTAKNTVPTSLPNSSACPVNSYLSVQCLGHHPSCSKYRNVHVLHKMLSHADRISSAPERRETSVALPTSNHILTRLDRNPGSLQWNGSRLESDCIESGRVELEPIGRGQFYAAPSFSAPGFQQQSIPAAEIKLPVGPLNRFQYSSTLTGSPPAVAHLPTFSVAESPTVPASSQSPNFASSTASHSQQTSRATVFDAMSVSSVLGTPMDLATTSIHGRVASIHFPMMNKAVLPGMLVNGGDVEGGHTYGNGGLGIHNQCMESWNTSVWLTAQNPLQASTPNYYPESSQGTVDMRMCTSQENQMEGFPMLSFTPGLLCGEVAFPKPPETLVILQPSDAGSMAIENLSGDSPSLLAGDTTVPYLQEEQSSGHMDEVAAQLLLNLARQTSDDKHIV